MAPVSDALCGPLPPVCVASITLPRQFSHAHATSRMFDAFRKRADRVARCAPSGSSGPRLLCAGMLPTASAVASVVRAKPGDPRLVEQRACAARCSPAVGLRSRGLRSLWPDHLRRAHSITNLRWRSRPSCVIKNWKGTSLPEKLGGAGGGARPRWLAACRAPVQCASAPRFLSRRDCNLNRAERAALIPDSSAAEYPSCASVH